MNKLSKETMMRAPSGLLLLISAAMVLAANRKLIQV